MIWVGLTGGIASGKSTVSRLLRERGFQVVDADQLARESSQKETVGFAGIVQAFGPDIIGADGELDRKKLGEIVFQDRQKLDVLEKILHPRVRELTLAKKSALAQTGVKVAFYDVPLLFEKSMESLFDRIVVVICSSERQLARLMSRNALKEDEALRRIRAQLPLEEKAKRGHDVIRNDGSIEELSRAVENYLAGLHQAQT